MIINYSFNNYCSFYGESEYSMEAAGGKVMKRYPDNYVSAGNGCKSEWLVHRIHSTHV